ncbi:MAG TPA: FtsX-like permease family protein [Gemmataceae bacterium]|jgi:putative ABC transport system permease protein
MRGRDLLGLALAALWQSKARTALTLAGVALGAGMLVVSLSLSHGLRTVVETEFRKDDGLRAVMVYQSWQAPTVDEAAIPPADLEVRGVAGEARRRRLRQLLVQRYRERQPYQTIPLTPDRLAAIAGMEHVVAVVPEVNERVEVAVNGSPRVARMELLSPGRGKLEDRLVCGRLPEPDRPELLASEAALLAWGVVADADVEGFVGRRLRLEVGGEPRAAPYQVLSLLGATAAGRQLSPEEQHALAGVAERLPDLVEHLDLPPAQGQVLKALLERAKADRSAGGKARRAAGEFTVVGVYYQEPGEDQDGWRFGRGDADLLVAPRPGQELLARLSNYADRGFDRATLLVDREDHVRGVLAGLKEMGLRTYAMVEWAERALQEVTLIGLGMTVLSVLALVVAGLGITNTMVTSVLERTHDIGIMKAVGARNGQVVGLFLVEGVVLGLLGGGLGLLGAWLFSLPAESWIRGVMEHQWQRKVGYTIFRFPPWLLATATLFAVLVTTAAALLPARRAARIDPAVTLRME